jgi:hypothetical protein
MSRLWRSWGLLWWWAVGAAWILAVHARVSSPSGRRHLAADTPRSVMLVVLVMALETAVVCAILRPWSGRRSVQRAILALASLGVWTLVALGPSMHASPAVVLHVAWLALTDVLLVGALIRALLTPGGGTDVVRHRRRLPDQAKRTE